MLAQVFAEGVFGVPQDSSKVPFLLKSLRLLIQLAGLQLWIDQCMPKQ